MAEMDERVLELLKRKQQTEQANDSLGVKENSYEWEESELFEGKMRILLPKSFVDLPMELAKVKYPMESRPQIIKSNQGCSENVTFSFLEVPLQNAEELEAAKEQMKTALKNYNPAHVFLESGQVECNSGIVTWFDYKSNAVDCKLYNLLFLCLIQDGVIIGTINCPFSEMNRWKPMGILMMKSVQVFDMEQAEE